MDFKKTVKLAGAFLGILNAKEIPVEDGKVAFSDEQMETLKAGGLSDEVVADAIDAFNKEISENSEVDKLEGEIQEMLSDLQEDPTGANKSKEKILDKGEGAGADATSGLAAIQTKINEKDALIKALMKGAEKDIPFEVIKNKGVAEMIAHSSTHLYASGKEYDEIAGRNWNKLATGQSTVATDWTASNSVNINKLNGDLDLFYRENPDKLNSLHRDNFGLPAHWPKRSGVFDKITAASIATAEITQARKLSWLPKNKQTIQAEEGKVYPISIDMEFVGHHLSEIEASWLSSFNKEGSQAYKLTFVRFLVMEFAKRARLEDRIATMKGIYVATPKDATTASSYINRQNGLLHIIWKARDIDKKYRSFNIGTPTASNIVDYIDTLLKSMPHEVRTSLGLELNLSPAWLKAYRKRTEALYGTHTDYKGLPNFPKDFPNIMFTENIDLEGSDFMFITPTNNIEILENVPKEKSLFTFELARRIVSVFADYKLGIRLMHIGNIVKAGDPAEFKVQSIWSNNVPIFDGDTFAPVYDDTTGEITATFNQLKVDGGWKTDITKIKGLAEGVIVKIKGDTSLLSVKEVKKNSDLVIASDFDLKTGGTLTMVVLKDGTLKELSRTTKVVSTIIAKTSFTTANLDASKGSEFVFGGAAALSISSILNGVQGNTVKIYGNGNGDVTVDTVGNIKVASTATLVKATDSISLILADGVWTEFDRSIIV